VSTALTDKRAKTQPSSF